MKVQNQLGIAIALALIALLAVPGIVVAAESAQSAPGESNLGFLLAGLLLAWGGFFAYVFYLSRKTREMHRDVAELRAQLIDKSSTPS